MPQTDDERLPQAVSEGIMEVGSIKLRIAVLDDGRRVIVDDENLRALLALLSDTGGDA